MSKLINKLPNHIAFIMDGNGRWATKRGLPRNLGHKEGVNAIERTILACLKYNIKYVTFYAFSTENWKRDKQEIDGIFQLLREYLDKSDNIFIENKIKLSYIGVLKPFPDDLKRVLLDTVEKTKNYNNLIVTFALNYGGRDEIVRAVNSLIKDGYRDVNEEDIRGYLDTKDMPDPDFIIRTSGEKRISNFLLFQMAYSEFFFPNILWPDFNERTLLKSLKEFEKRDRRYGGVH